MDLRNEMIIKHLRTRLGKSKVLMNRIWKLLDCARRLVLTLKCYETYLLDPFGETRKLLACILGTFVMSCFLICFVLVCILVTYGRGVAHKIIYLEATCVLVATVSFLINCKSCFCLGIGCEFCSIDHKSQ